MVYNFKEYKQILDTPAKKNQEKVIIQKIINLLNNNKYDNFEEFKKANLNYQDFLKKQQMDSVLKHFGNTITEQEFKSILINFEVLTNTKSTSDKSKIETTTIDGTEYNSLEGEEKTYFFINNSKKGIDDQMKEMKDNSPDFQTSDPKRNTENMFKSLEENTKESLHLSFLNDINIGSLNDEEKFVFETAKTYQSHIGVPIKLDIQKKVLVDSTNNIFKIKNINGEFIVIGAENSSKTIEDVEPTKQMQKTLGTIPATYNN